jgi:indole-3-glycerol phosphate synthase/phosphoribosylanthranilate isomerase/anthranilate synthase/indole-3-glycerol phosphate synthase/phosphoribosylanthranilate isomerase
MNRKNFLRDIVERKRAHLESSQAHASIARLRALAFEAREGAPRHALRRALIAGNSINVIAEIKRASPSKGKIRDGIVPEETARAYVSGGAVAVSVLTEEDYFDGSLDDLRAVGKAVNLPVLRKDFIIDEFQLYESAEAGADALLLIAAILSDEQLSSFRRIAEKELGMDVLVEVHSSEEMQRAKQSGATLIGVNNRNLETFEVSLDVSKDLAGEAPEGAILVSESGLSSGEDLRKLQEYGYKGFLIGEALMRATDPAVALQSLLHDACRGKRVRVKICGITNLEDARMSVDAGADMLGFNFYRRSPRYIEPENARRIIERLPATVQSVGVFVNEENPQRVADIADIADIDIIQLHGDESPSYCQALKERRVIKAIRVDNDFSSAQVAEYQTEAILLDTFSGAARGGTGESFDWTIAKQARQLVSRLFLAGGLTPNNVARAIATVTPYAVDACSSLESAPGKKDERRVREFIAAARSAAEENQEVLRATP